MSELSSTQRDMLEHLMLTTDLIVASSGQGFPSAANRGRIDQPPMYRHFDRPSSQTPIRIAKRVIEEWGAPEISKQLNLNTGGVQIGYQPKHYLHFLRSRPVLQPEAAFFVIHTGGEEGIVDYVAEIQSPTSELDFDVACSGFTPGFMPDDAPHTIESGGIASLGEHRLRQLVALNDLVIRNTLL